MDLDKLFTLVYRVFFIGSFVLFVIAAFERFLKFLGYTLIKDVLYSPERLLELAAITILFVMAILLRDVRNVLRGNNK